MAADDTDIRDALTAATRHITAPPDLLDRVHAGGRRRGNRRRALAHRAPADARHPVLLDREHEQRGIRGAGGETDLHRENLVD